MSDDVCKACSGNATELYPIGQRNYLGIDISQIICNVLQLNIEPTFGNSLICSSCITTLHLINEKIHNLRRAFAPPVEQTPFVSGCLTRSKKSLNANNSVGTVKEIVEAKKTPVAKKSTNGEIKLNAKRRDTVVLPMGVEYSLSYADINEEHSSTRLPEESEKKEKQIPKRRNSIYHFDCGICDFQTGMVKTMQQHMKDTHDVKTPRLFECKLCSTKYVSKQALDYHNKKHHPETEKNATHQNAKPATPDVRSSPQKLKAPSDIKKRPNFNSSDHVVSPKKLSPLSEPVSKKLYKCDQCPIECDSAFRLDLHRSLKHCFIPNQSDDDDDDDYNETTLGISNGLDGSNLNEQEVPETDSDFNNEQVIPSPKKLPKASKSQESRVPGISSVCPPRGKSKFNTKCDFCTIFFNSPKIYANHLINQHGIEEPRVFKCTQCDKTYKTQGVLGRHIRNAHEKINNNVDVASDYENDKDDGDDDSIVEVSCYEAKETLQKHDDNASNSSMEFPFQIAKINALPVRTSLGQNGADELMEKIDLTQTCPQCGQELYSMFALKRHLKEEHNDSNEAIYVCNLCPAKYKHNKNLKMHKEQHHSSNANEDLDSDTDHLIISVGDNGSQHIKKQKKSMVVTPAKNNSFHTDDAETETISVRKRKRKDSKSKENLANSENTEHSLRFHEDQLAELDSNSQLQELNKSFQSKGRLKLHNKKKQHTVKQFELYACRVGFCQKQFMTQLHLDMHIKKKHRRKAF